MTEISVAQLAVVNGGAWGWRNTVQAAGIAAGLLTGSGAAGATLSPLQISPAPIVQLAK